jgi:hypothetical protein
MIGRLPHASARARRRKLVAVDAQMMSGDDDDEAEGDDADVGVKEGWRRGKDTPVMLDKLGVLDA